MNDRIPFRVQPMLATLVDSPFHKPGWVYEEKYDGVRLLAYKEGKRVQLWAEFFAECQFAEGRTPARP